MEISPIQGPIDASRLTAEQVAGNSRLSEAEKVAELSRQFEAVLLRQILKDAHKTVIKSDLKSDSAVSEIYTDMITTQLAETISQSGSFGFAQSLEQELTRQLLPPSSEPQPSHE